MKRLAILFALILCLSLCACKPATSSPGEVQISAGKIETGMSVNDILVEVTVDGQPVRCDVQITELTNEGMRIMATDELIPENFFGRLDVYYTLPEGMSVEDINVTMECDGGEYDGTGWGPDEKPDDGCEVAWSHAIYGEEPEDGGMHEVEIRVIEFGVGMTLDKVEVEVTIDGEPVECRLGATLHNDNGFRDLEEGEAIPANYSVKLDVYYYLPDGVTLDDINVTMEGEDGEYDGTGSAASDDDGRIEAWSHAFFDFNDEQEPVQEEEPEQEEKHTHKWKENKSMSKAADCTKDGYKTYVCNCGETKRETISAKGHSWEEDKSLREPASCTKEGSKTYVCDCGKTKNETISATGHDWSDWEYLNGRLHERSCRTCGASEEENHNVPSGTVTCTGCGYDIIN